MPTVEAMNTAARSRHHRVSLLDAGLATLLTTASVALLVLYLYGAGTKLSYVIGSQANLREHLLAWSVGAVGSIAGLVIRHRLPAAALVLAAGGAAVHYADSALPHLPLDLAAPIALYTMASTAPARRTSCAALAGTLVTAAALTLVSQYGLIVKGSHMPSVTVAEHLGGAAVVPVLLLAIAWVAGDAARTRQAYLQALQQRAADLERERAQRDALATAAERARLTREMHDVIAHGLSVMVAQAQGAAAAVRRHPERSRAALDEVIATGRQSLAEMRQLLGTARGCVDGVLLSPQPGLGALPGLVDQVRRAGTEVHLAFDGESAVLPAALDASAYRIVQEALTNTRKHGGDGARASVRIVFSSTRMEIDIADDGPGVAHANSHDTDGQPSGQPGDEGAGNGLRGIRERVELLGGQVTAGPRAEGGFGVHAILPLPAMP